MKGIRQGLLVTLGERDWNARLRVLEARLGANPAFFRGGGKGGGDEGKSNYGYFGQRRGG